MKLRLEQVTVAHGERVLLDSLDLALNTGGLVALVGANGAGKTTLLRSVLGLTKLTRGRVWLDDASLTTLPPRERAARVAWLPQHASGGDDLTALEVVAMARYRFDEPFGTSARQARAALDRVGADSLAARTLATLSGGERQRVALASLLSQEAPLLLVDEPANHLDPAQQIDVYRLLGELWREGKSVVLVTHDVNLLRHLGASEHVRVVGLAQGRARFDLSLTSPELPGELGRLFGVRMRELTLDGARVLLAERSP